MISHYDLTTRLLSKTQSNSRLLNPLAHNDFILRDSFDAVICVCSMPQNLFLEGYRFVSFDVKPLFINIPLKKTVGIILHRIYNEKQLDTSLKDDTLVIAKPSDEPTILELNSYHL